LVCEKTDFGKAEQRKVKTMDFSRLERDGASKMETKTKTCPLKKGSGLLKERECELENCAWYYGADCAIKTIAGCLESRCET
jgi:hypothetical protein